MGKHNGESPFMDKNEYGKKILVAVYEDEVYEYAINQDKTAPKRMRKYQITADKGILLTEWIEGSTRKLVKHLSEGYFEII